jgi:hypothetical protein
MGRITLAVRAFFAVLFGSVPAEAMRALLLGDAGVPPAGAGAVTTSRPMSAPERPAERKRSRRNDAISLLATLQREARFVDLVQEPLQNYSDQQIGAAARDVLRDCRSVLSRLFDLQPVADADENSQVEAPSDGSGRWRITGKVEGGPPFRGRLVHHGWEAARCELPQWSGGEESVAVIAPAEVELE